MKLLIDGDIVAYQVACRVEKGIDWDGDGDLSAPDHLPDALIETAAWIHNLKQHLDASEAIICMGDPSRRYFRHGIFPAYKQARTQGSVPSILPAVKDYLRQPVKEGIEAESAWYPGLEADDVISMLAGGDTCVVSEDKDLLQIPGLHYQTHRKELGVRTIDRYTAAKYFWTQALMGDPTDGIPGARKIGPVKAKRFLDKLSDEDLLREEVVWPVVKAVYAQQGHDEDYALQQVRCVRLVKAGEYDHEKGQVELWVPRID